MEEDIGQKIKTGALWTYVQTVVVTGSQFVAGVLLARMLGPEDFGVFIAVTAITAILSMQVKFGLDHAIVQAKEINDEQINACFWVMQSIALILAVLFYFCLPYLQDVYEDPRFIGLSLVMMVSFFLIPINSINQARIRRDLRFVLLSKTYMSSIFVALAVSLLLAYFGFGPYSMAISGLFVMVVELFLYARYQVLWLPRWPSFRSVSALARYGWFANINSIQSTITEKIDNILIGIYLNTNLLAIYNRAYSLARLPVTELGQSIFPVVFGGLSRAQHDEDYTRALYQKSLCTLSLVVFPFLVLFLFIGESFIQVLYGSEWIGAAEPLKYMIVGAFATLFSITLRSIVAAQNLVAKEVWINLAGMVITIGVVVGFSQWGLTAIAIGISVREIVVLLLLKQLIHRSSINIGWVDLWQAAWPSLLACSVMAALTALFMADIRSWVPGDLGYLVMVSVSMGAIYALTVGVLLLVFRNHMGLRATGDVIVDTGLAALKQVRKG